MRVRIADLFPYECAGVNLRYDKAIQIIESGQAIDTPHVTILRSGEIMAVDGNNRIKAAKDKGWVEIDVVLDKSRTKEQMRLFENTLILRKCKGQKGFENFSIVSEKERERLTDEEFEEILKPP
ncbi:MAG: hypothetical protein NTX50_03135 [Candidatus Sumerlaeota bacterium]|nr:hypothetical protein [Candidatus Sumerlaeota bacterium]